MTKPRKVSGLIEAMTAEIEGVDWEFSNEAAATSGLGLGATPRAMELVRKGLQFERFELLLSAVSENSVQPKRGQPKKNPKLKNDAKRALLLYMTAERIRETQGIPRTAKIEMPIKKMIYLAKELFPTHGLFDRISRDNKLYESVKRGRCYFDIDEFWRGKPIEEIL